MQAISLIRFYHFYSPNSFKHYIIVPTCLMLIICRSILTLGLHDGHTLDFGNSQIQRCKHIPPKHDQIVHVWSNLTIDSVDQDPTNHHHNIYRRSPPLSPRIPLRIDVFYDDSVNALDAKKVILINGTVMPAVVEFFQNVLTIKRDDALHRFQIARKCPQNTIFYIPTGTGGPSRPHCIDRCEDYATCGEITVPTSHLAACSYCNSHDHRCRTDLSTDGPGVIGAQFLLYVSANQTSRCKKDQTIAYAAHCAQDLRTDRPIAGHANLCPSSISTDPKDLKALIATVKHELTHVLGFSVSLFAYYRDANGRPLTPRDPSTGRIPINQETGFAQWSEATIKTIERRGWSTGDGPINKTIHAVITPAVTQAVREHFNCSSLEGAELEDQGSDGTSITHWEKRLFENEAMTGTHTQNSVYSKLTLAILQDTGWYIPDYNRAEQLEWGKDLGCNFAKKSCKSWIDERRAMKLSIRPFCDKPKGDLLQISCTDDGNSKAVCNMKSFDKPLPAMYVNFNYIDGVPHSDLAYYGGSVDLADYCPFIQEFTWQAKNITVRGSRCEFDGNNLDNERNAALEYYGSQTKCFEHGRRWEQRSCHYRRHWHHYGAGCYKYSCDGGHLSIIVENYTYPCYYPDQIIQIELLTDHWLHTGTILCPPCKKICPINKCTLNATNSVRDGIDNDKTLTSIELVAANTKTNSFRDLTTEHNGNTSHIIADDQLKASHDRNNFSTAPKHHLICSSSSSKVIDSRYMISAALAWSILWGLDFVRVINLYYFRMQIDQSV